MTQSSPAAAGVDTLRRRAIRHEYFAVGWNTPGAAAARAAYVRYAAPTGRSQACRSGSK
jgi:hypothetical protein